MTREGSYISASTERENHRNVQTPVEDHRIMRFVERRIIGSSGVSRQSLEGRIIHFAKHRQEDHRIMRASRLQWRIPERKVMSGRFIGSCVCPDSHERNICSFRNRCKTFRFATSIPTRLRLEKYLCEKPLRKGASPCARRR